MGKAASTVALDTRSRISTRGRVLIASIAAIAENSYCMENPAEIEKVHLDEGEDVIKDRSIEDSLIRSIRLDLSIRRETIYLTVALSQINTLERRIETPRGGPRVFPRTRLAGSQMREKRKKRKRDNGTAEGNDKRCDAPSCNDKSSFSALAKGRRGEARGCPEDGNGESRRAIRHKSRVSRCISTRARVKRRHVTPDSR